MRKGLNNFFDGGDQVSSGWKIFFYHYKCTQIHACENDICEYQNVDQIKFFKKKHDLHVFILFFYIKNNQICCPLLLLLLSNHLY